MNYAVSLGFSPCPNDTFMFDALVNKRIAADRLNFESHLADVEELNRLALEKKLDVTKLSISAFARVADHYQILDAGSALGDNCGPLLVSKNNYSFSEIKNLKIAIPGKYTTANLLLSIFAPEATNKTEVIFSEIEQQVLSGTFDAGLIIHESRFTYAMRGLKKIADLGELWQQQFQTPVALGCIAVKKTLPEEIKQKINNLVRNSVDFAFKHPDASASFVKKHAQEMSDDVIASHIKLYVNNFSVNLGKDGKKSVEHLLSQGNKQGLLPAVDDIFLVKE